MGQGLGGAAALAPLINAGARRLTTRVLKLSTPPKAGKTNLKYNIRRNPNEKQH